MFEKVAEIIAEQVGISVEEIKPESKFTDDLGVDSLDLFQIIMALEEEFGIEEMGDEDVSAIATVGDVVHFLQSRLD